jgi:hypothetical protein
MVSKKLLKVGYPDLDQIEPWQLRNFLSYSQITDLYSDTGYLELEKFQDPRLTKISIRQLVDQFEQTIRHLMDICQFKLVRDDFDRIYSAWVEKQFHINKDQLVKTIVNHIVQGSYFEWSPLTLVDEAFIEWTLRDLYGLDMKCYNVNVFPTNTTDLRNLLINE